MIVNIIITEITGTSIEIIVVNEYYFDF